MIPLGGQDGKDIERTVVEFARGSNCGLIAVASPLINNNSNLDHLSRSPTPIADDLSVPFLRR